MAEKEITPYDGANGCLRMARDACRYLAENERPAGGEQKFNSAHLHQIADELDKEMTAIRRMLKR